MNVLSEKLKNVRTTQDAEVQHILGNPPAWIIRWGILIILAATSIAIGISAIIHYPDVIDGQVVITKTSTETIEVQGLFTPNKVTRLPANANVKIEINNFSASEYGYLNGTLQHCSTALTSNPSGKGNLNICPLQLSTQNLITSKGKEISFEDKINGKVYIELEERSLLSRMLEQFFRH